MIVLAIATVDALFKGKVVRADMGAYSAAWVGKPVRVHDLRDPVGTVTKFAITADGEVRLEFEVTDPETQARLRSGELLYMQRGHGFKLSEDGTELVSVTPLGGVLRETEQTFTLL